VLVKQFFLDIFFSIYLLLVVLVFKNLEIVW